MTNAETIPDWFRQAVGQAGSDTEVLRFIRYALGQMDYDPQFADSMCELIVAGHPQFAVTGRRQCPLEVPCEVLAKQLRAFSRIAARDAQHIPNDGYFGRERLLGKSHAYALAADKIDELLRSLDPGDPFLVAARNGARIAD